MTELARLRFKSIQSPKEHGALLIHDDGTLEIVASEALRDEMARREELAIKRSKTLSSWIGLSLLGLGAVVIAIGWWAGRAFGKLGQNLSNPRPLSEVDINKDENGVVTVKFPGVPGQPQMVEMQWNPDEIRPDDVDKFFSTLSDIRGDPSRR
jgi:hypothetical protein